MTLVCSFAGAEYLLGSYYGRPAGPVVTPYQAIANRVAAHNSQQPVGLGANVEVEIMAGAEVMGTGVYWR